MTPALSILMPTYNGAHYLPEQVDTILAQSFGDFELVTTDDGSTDETRTMIADYARRDPRVRILPSQGNRGQTARLGELLAASSAPLVAMADQDDVWAPDKLSRLVAAIGPASLAFGPSELIDGTGAPLGYSLLHTAPPLPTDGDRLVYLFKPVVSAHALVVRRDRFSPVALRRTHWFDQLVGLDSVFSDGVRFVPQAITYHRLHGANQCNGGAADGRGLYERLVKGLPIWQHRIQRTERWHLVQRLEHLTFSECIASDLRSMFRKLMNACVGAWFSSSDLHRVSNADLRRLLTATLEPMQGSGADWAYARYAIEGLTRRVVHPRLAYRSLRAVVRG